MLLITLLGTPAAYAQTYNSVLADHTAFAALPGLTEVPEGPLVAFSTPFVPRIGGAASQPPGEIALRRGFFKPLRFTFGGGEPKEVFSWSGLTFNDDFEEVMGQHPQAMDTAGRARMYNGVAGAGSLLMVVGGFQMLKGTLDQIDEINQGNLYMEDSSAKGVGTFLVGAVVVGLGSVLSNRALKRGVRMFNERQRVQVGTAGRARQ